MDKKLIQNHKKEKSKQGYTNKKYDTLASIITLLDEIAKIDINVIIFETHYTSVNKDILELIKKKLPNKQFIIELGFESSNQEYRKKYLNKIIDNDKFIEKVNLIKSFGFEVETNIIFGMPFLSSEDQIKDTIQSILWCFQNNIDTVNLFPMNIKPYTLLYKFYKTDKYKYHSKKDGIFYYVLYYPPSFVLLVKTHRELGFV